MSNSILDQRWPWLVGAAAIVAAYLLTSGTSIDPTQGPADPRQPGTIDQLNELRDRDDVNVLFILVDTLRSDRLSSYGYHRETSPFMDKLASSGIRFERHLAQSSWTKASMASMWMGLNPWRAGITRFDHVLPDEAEMPAEILRDAGFRTIGLYRNGWVASTFGFEQGFEVYNRPPPLGRRADLAEKPTLRKGGTDEDVTASAIEFLRVHNEGRWFLYLHLMDVHEYVYDEESAFFGSQYSDIYDNSIRWTDGTIQVLTEHLIDQGYADNTLIVITSDHGEAFSERGFEGHGRQVFKETTEIPLIITMPFLLEPGVVVPTRSRGIDVWPTLFDLLGIGTSRETDGRSLVPDILASARGEAVPAADRIGLAYLEQGWGQPQQAEKNITVQVADGPLRYVRTPLEQNLAEQLFDSSRDPAELKNLSESDAANLTRLRSIADSRLSEPPAFGDTKTRELGEMELNQLRAIGYDVGG